MFAAAAPSPNVQLEQPVVGVEDVELAAAPLDAQRTAALLLVLQGELLRLCLVEADGGTTDSSAV